MGDLIEATLPDGESVRRSAAEWLDGLEPDAAPAEILGPILVELRRRIPDDVAGRRRAMSIRVRSGNTT